MADRRLDFVALGIPKAQPRVKAFRRGNHAGVFDPGTADEWKLTVAAAARIAWDKVKFTGPLHLTLSFFMPRPKAHYRSNGEVKPMAPRWHESKPDADNLAKAVMDALTQLGIWIDDSQVVGLDIRKTYSERPGCLVFLSPASSQDELSTLKLTHSKE